MKYIIFISLAGLCSGCVTMSRKEFDEIMVSRQKDGIIEGLKMCTPCPPETFKGDLQLGDTVYHGIMAPFDHLEGK